MRQSTASGFRPPKTNWSRVLAINTMVTALCFPMTGGLSEATWSGMFRALLASALYVNTLGTASAVIIPRLLARFEGYGRGARLTVQVGAALAILALGFPTVPVLMVAIGLIDTNDYLELAVPLDWPVYALFAAVIVTIGITLYEGMNRDLQAKLRTKERGRRAPARCRGPAGVARVAGPAALPLQRAELDRGAHSSRSWPG
jgi:hypothetical protein